MYISYFTRDLLLYRNTHLELEQNKRKQNSKGQRVKKERNSFMSIEVNDDDDDVFQR